METRRVQRTGKSTFIVSLPKNWALNNGIEAGSIIYITQSDNGALVLTPERSERGQNVKLEIGNKCGDALIRDIIGCYVSGYRTIEATSAHMTTSQKKDIHQIVQKLIGPEILEETIGKVLIQDLLSSEELQVERALRRIRTVVKSMVQDSINALIQGNKELAMDVVQRDDDIDRLNLLISRQFTEILRSGSIRQQGLDPITAFNFGQAASNLERMADHASRIAEVIQKYDVKLPEAITSELAELESIYCGLIDDSVSCLLTKNSERANQIIEQTRIIRKRSPLMVDAIKVNEKGEMMVRVVVSSSLERIMDYVKNIGELTINLTQAEAASRKR